MADGALAAAIADLRARIVEAFPAEPFHGVVTECPCDECTEIRKGLRGKRWDEVSGEFLDFNCSPALLEPEAFRAFLPAYMMRSLDGFGDSTTINPTITEFTLYNLSPNPEDWSADSAAGRRKYLWNRAKVMDNCQVKVIREFLTFVAEYDRSGEFYRGYVEAALRNLWILPATNEKPV